MEPLSIKEKSLVKLVLRSTIGNKYFDVEKFSPPAGLALPEKFVATDLPIFKVTNNPQNYLMCFTGTMALKGVDPKLYALTFPLSLDLAPREWYYGLDLKFKATWED